MRLGNTACTHVAGGGRRLAQDDVSTRVRVGVRVALDIVSTPRCLTPRSSIRAAYRRGARLRIGPLIMTRFGAAHVSGDHAFGGSEIRILAIRRSYEANGRTVIPYRVCR
jgi:hypothetical protein